MNQGPGVLVPFFIFTEGEQPVIQRCRFDGSSRGQKAVAVIRASTKLGEAEVSGG